MALTFTPSNKNAKRAASSQGAITVQVVFQFAGRSHSHGTGADQFGIPFALTSAFLPREGGRQLVDAKVNS
jgi:hypothetical protein